MRIYLDNNATTQPLPAVVKAMLPFMEQSFGNPSSLHLMGLEARKAVEKARDTVAAMIHAKTPTEIVFTSCATESISHAFQSICGNCGGARQHIIVSAVEHTAVLEAAEKYKHKGSLLTAIAVNSEGALDLQQLEDAISNRPAFVSVMLANNETGVLFPVKEIAAICERKAAILHVDAVQAAGRMPLDVQSLKCDYLSLSAHKFHGPKGVGALYIREGALKSPFIRGHQENHLRGGTENVAGIVGLAAAIDNLFSGQEKPDSIRSLRDLLERNLLPQIPGAAVNGASAPRICNTSNIHIPERNAADLVENLSHLGVFISAGAACTNGGEPSHVIQAMFRSRSRANGSIRLSLSRFTTTEEINLAIKAVVKAYHATLPVNADD
jgi:cysteine desulfurase